MVQRTQILSDVLDIIIIGNRVEASAFILQNYRSIIMLKKYITSVLLAMTCASLFAQTVTSGSFGDTYIPSEGFISIFGTHTFENADIGLYPGVILAERNGISGVVNFSSESSCKGASYDAHVDGTVRTFSSDPFVFPTGNSEKLGLLGISGMTDAAAKYSHSDPTLTTGELNITNPEIDATSALEFWTLDGSGETNVTLTWDPDSNIEGLVEGDLDKLTIIGWTMSGWEVIPSIPNEFSLLSDSRHIFNPESESGFSYGSISTSSPIVPSDYEILTLGSLVIPRTGISDGPILKIFPNPVKLGTNSYVYYELKGNQGKMEVYDELNNLVFSKLLDRPSGNILLPNLHQSDDKYIVTVVEIDGKKTSKMLITIQ